MKLNFICEGANTAGPLLISLADKEGGDIWAEGSEKLPAMQQIPNIVNTGTNQPRLIISGVKLG